MNIAFIGLGRMGWHMAGHLARQGHPIVVYDAKDGVGQAWSTNFKGEFATTLSSAISHANLVITALPADIHLKAVWQECFDQLSSGTVWIDHSTTSASIARELFEQGQACDISFIDAPVSGGTAGAERGALTIMAGGSESAWAQISPIIECYASKATWLGPSGSGQLTKMANQICVAGVGQALAEGLAFAQRERLDVQKVLSVMLKGSSTSWMMENRSDAMLKRQYDFGFSSALMKKDLGLVLDEARQRAISLPVTELVAQLLDELSSIADPAWDWCSLIERQHQSSRQN